MVGAFSPLFAPSLQQTGVRVEALRYRGESGMKPCLAHGLLSLPGKEDIQRLTP